MTRSQSTGLTVEQVQAMLHRELSTPTRVGYLLMLLVTLLAAGLVGMLWLTEPRSLPVRTHLAFSALVAINLAWAALSGWVVTRRKVLFAAHNVIAGWMAVTFCTVFLASGIVIAMVRMNLLALVAVVLVGGAQLFAAVAVLIHARRRRRQLLSRRSELSDMLSERLRP
jgi:hypothetical protein